MCTHTDYPCTFYLGGPQSSAYFKDRGPLELRLTPFAFPPPLFFELTPAKSCRMSGSIGLFRNTHMSGFNYWLLYSVGSLNDNEPLHQLEPPPWECTWIGRGNISGRWWWNTPATRMRLCHISIRKNEAPALWDLMDSCKVPHLLTPRLLPSTIRVFPSHLHIWMKL